MAKGMANWEMFNAINKGCLIMAGVRSDGGHQMQENPAASSNSGFVMVWPTIVYRSQSCPSKWYSYCQGLALEGASPWVCSPDALEFYGPYQLIVDPIDISQIPSTVQIEELPSDGDEDFEVVEIEAMYENYSWVNL